MIGTVGEIICTHKRFEHIRLNVIYWKGYRHYKQARSSVFDCPYGFDTIEADKWIEGYLKAEKEILGF